MEEAEGRIALQTLMPGDVITQSKLRPTGGPAGIMTYKIPEGHRAITVAVDQVSGVAGFITPGSMVDVVVTTEPPGKRDPISRIVFQNVPVLATGQIVEQREGEPVLVPTVTLDLSPEDSERMTLASSEGKLRLLLRRAGDTEVTATSGATVAKVLSVPGKPRIKRVARRTTRTAARRPAKPAPKGPTFENLSVEIWRSTAKTVETFKVEKEAK
jgi:pilus assembly protein CpaB